MSASLQTTPRGEWTRFRGSNGTGISTATIPLPFAPKNIRWKATLPGKGHSSPVVWRENLYVINAEESVGRRHVLCLSARTGKTLWKDTETFIAYHHHKLNNAAATTPTVDERGVYVALPTPERLVVKAFDHSGKLLWTCDLGVLTTQHGGAASPIVVGETLILTAEQEGASEGAVFGLDRRTGTTRWKLPRRSGQNSSYATPMEWNGEVLLASAAHGITSIHPQTGAVNWEVGGLFTARCVASPVLVKGLVFATAGSGGGARQAAAVKPGTKPEVVYKLRRGPSYVPTPIAYQDWLFAWGDGGIVTCLKPETGDTVWQERVGGDFFGSPICVNGKLCAISTKGDLTVVEASDKFRLLGTVPLGDPSHATPAVAGGVLYLRTESQVWAVG